MIRKNNALLLKEKYDEENRMSMSKKQFTMKRFAGVNPRTNTHNVGVTRSVANLQASISQEPPAPSMPAQSQMGDKTPAVPES